MRHSVGHRCCADSHQWPGTRRVFDGFHYAREHISDHEAQPHSHFINPERDIRSRGAGVTRALFRLAQSATCCPYRFIRKTYHSAAYYQIDEEQARVVRWMFKLYSVQGISIGAITRLLNEQAIPTCKRRGRWERSTVWGMLRNPAYKGQACFGKTMIAPRQRITRPIRMRGGIATPTALATRGLDHDRRAADRQRRDLCARA
jgi:hypothetical protein